MKKKERENLAWELISDLPTCSQGHIISHKDVVECMVKFSEILDKKSNKDTNIDIVSKLEKRIESLNDTIICLRQRIDHILKNPPRYKRYKINSK